MITGPLKCIPGASPAVDAIEDKIMDAARAAGGAIAALIPDLKLPFKPISLLKPQKLFCKEVWKTPGFAQAPCAKELGCKTAGSGAPSLSEVEAAPPEQVQPMIRRPHVDDTGSRPSSDQCHLIPMGDRFIQLGNFRIAAIDHSHLSISHKDPCLHAQKVDFSVPARLPMPSLMVRQHVNQRAKFQDGSVNAIWRDDGKTFYDHQPYAYNDMLLGELIGDFLVMNVLDRFPGTPSGIDYGDKWIQIGNFRIGEIRNTDGFGNHWDELLLAHIDPHHVRVIEAFRSDGTHEWKRGQDNHPNLVNSDYRKTQLLGLSPTGWDCKSLAEMAHGECRATFGSWGDRFFQIGDWRIGAIDENNFGITHRNGNNAAARAPSALLG
ncbi:unnamed protein product [Symbiodinium sp. CCMP2592]|nr:unnamed protein product [Symbiodinium sp. CCMP2592]